MPDVDAAVDFLVKWCSPTASPAVLTFLNPDGPGIRTAAFTEAEQARDAISYWGGRRWNCYWQVNADRREPTSITSKGSRADIAEAVALHLDDDCYKRGEAKDVVIERLMGLGAPLGMPSVIIDTGNGVQALWLLEEPVGLDVDAVESRNRWIAAQLNGDAVHDVSRILRLPGTLNFPSPSKVKQGLGIGRARLVLFDDERRVALEDVPALEGRPALDGQMAIEIEGVEDDEIPEGRLRAIHRDGRVEGETLPDDDSGSAWAFRLALGLVRLGWPEGRVAGALLTSAWLLGKDGSVDVERQAVRTAARAAQAVAEWREERKRMFDNWHDVGEGVIRNG